MKLIIIGLFSLSWVVILCFYGIGAVAGGIELFALGLLFGQILTETIDKELEDE